MHKQLEEMRITTTDGELSELLHANDMVIQIVYFWMVKINLDSKAILCRTTSDSLTKTSGIRQKGTSERTPIFPFEHFISLLHGTLDVVSKSIGLPEFVNVVCTCITTS